MQAVLIAVLGFLGVVTTGLAGWLVAVHQHSGRVGTSDAEPLWAEGKAMRQELREELKGVREDNAELREEIGKCLAKIDLMQTTITSLENEVRDLKRSLQAKAPTRRQKPS